MPHRTTQDDVRRLLADALEGEGDGQRRQAVEVKQILQVVREPTWVPAFVSIIAAAVSIVAACVVVLRVVAGEP